MNSDHINRSAIRTRVTQAQAGNPKHVERKEAAYGNRHEHFEHKFTFIVSIEGLGSVPRFVPTQSTTQVTRMYTNETHSAANKEMHLTQHHNHTFNDKDT